MPPSRKSRRRRPGSKRSKQRSKQRSRRRNLAGGVRPSASTVAALALGSTVGALGAVGAVGAVGAAGGLSVLKKPVAFNEISMTKLINDAKTMSELYLVGAKLLVTFTENTESSSFDRLKPLISTVLSTKKRYILLKETETIELQWGIKLSDRVHQMVEDIQNVELVKTKEKED